MSTRTDEMKKQVKECGNNVKEFVKDKNGNLMAVKIVKLAWEKDAESGRMVMKEVAGSEFEIKADLVLIAARPLRPL